MGKLKAFIFSVLLFFSTKGFNQVKQNNTLKQSTKSDIGFISVLYYHLFDENISNRELDSYLTLLASYGDKEMGYKMILNNIMHLFKKRLDGQQNGRVKINKINVLRDSKQIQQLHSLKSDIEKISFLIKFLLLNEIQLNTSQKPFFSKFDQTFAENKTTIPHLSQIVYEEIEPVCENIEKAVIQHPGELQFLINYYYTKTHDSIPISGIEEKLVSLFPYYDYFLYCENYTFDDKKDKKFNYFCKSDGANKTIHKLYWRFLNRAPQNKELEIVGAIFKQNDFDKSVFITLYLIVNSAEYRLN